MAKRDITHSHIIEFLNITNITCQCKTILQTKTNIHRLWFKFCKLSIKLHFFRIFINLFSQTNKCIYRYIMRLFSFLFIILILECHLWQICYHKCQCHISILHLHKVNLHIFWILSYTQIRSIGPHHWCICMSINYWRLSMQTTRMPIYLCLRHQPIEQCLLLWMFFI